MCAQALEGAASAVSSTRHATVVGDLVFMKFVFIG